MKILIVEDDVEKAREILDAACSCPGCSSSNISSVSSIIDAKSSMIDDQFDLLVLDVYLPLRSGEQPKPNGGALLLEQIMVSKRFKIPTIVVGLTAYEDVAEASLKAFSDYTSIILKYDRASDTWKNRLVTRIEQILTIKPDALNSGVALPAAKTHIVILIHGIRTHASWAEMVSAILEKNKNVAVVPIRYGFFDLFRFLSPLLTRGAPIKRIIRELRDIKADHPNANLSIIAHSFGTYAVSKVLEEPDIRLYRLILCGCIIRRDFRRARYRGQLGTDVILNECGSNDIWPVLAESLTWGFGASGTFGFGTAGIRDRFSNAGHSDMFNRQFVERYWAPFIVDGHIIASDWESSRPTPPYWLSVLIWLHLKYLIIIALIVIVARLAIHKI